MTKFIFSYENNFELNKKIKKINKRKYIRQEKCMILKACLHYFNLNGKSVCINLFGKHLRLLKEIEFMLKYDCHKLPV